MKLRILHTNMHRGGWGGQPNRILLLSKGLVERGHHVVIAAPKGATLIKRAREAGIPTYDDLEFPKKFKPHVFVSEVIKLKKLIEREKIDIVHTHGSQDTWVATIAAKLARNRPVVVRTRHNTFPVANHFANRLLYRMIDHLVVVSQGIIDIYKKSGVLGDRINGVTTIYSVIDPARFEDAERQAEKVVREFPQIGGFILTNVGRLAPEKGHDRLLEVARKLKGLFRFRLFVLGEGPLRRELERKRDSKGLEEVVFTGLRSDVPGFLRASDVFVFTPVSGESLGTAVLEAMYMGVPPVSFLVRGVDASVEHGKTGFLAEVGDDVKMAGAVKKILSNRALRKRLGLNGRAKIGRCFVLSCLLDSTEALYKSLLRT